MTDKSLYVHAGAAADGTRRRQRRKEARPAELIAAGLAEFAARGFTGARLEDVARRAGVAKGTIYRYFADKEALFLAAVRSRVTPVFEQIGGAVDVFPGSTRELLTFVITTSHQNMANPDVLTLMRIIIAEGERFPELTELYHRETVAKGMALMERIVARGLARGEVREGALTRLPMVLAGPSLMAAVWRLSFDRHAPLPAEAFVAAHLDLVFNGLLKQEAPPAASP